MKCQTDRFNFEVEAFAIVEATVVLYGYVIACSTRILLDI